MAGSSFGSLFTREPNISDDGKLEIEGLNEYAGRNLPQVGLNGDVTGSGTAILYTVPADKILFLSHYSIQLTANGTAAVNWYVWMYTGANWEIFQFFRGSGIATFEIIHGSFPMPFKISAGRSVRINCDDATGNIHVNILGWLEDA